MWESELGHKGERRLSCVQAMAFSGATWSRHPGRGDRKPGGIRSVNRNPGAKSAPTDDTPGRVVYPVCDFSKPQLTTDGYEEAVH